uniref:Uncharacterized protein n=1 Tax=Salix viminalis TaxID=40686 RepID=A0A6N2KY25_SALVM
MRCVCVFGCINMF